MQIITINLPPAMDLALSRSSVRSTRAMLITTSTVDGREQHTNDGTLTANSTTYAHCCGCFASLATLNCLALCCRVAVN